LQQQYVPNYTGQGWAGKNYKSGQDTKTNTAEIRKIIRKLWPAKEGYRISVRMESYSGGSSINIDIKAAPFRVFRPEYTALYKQATETRNWDTIRRLQDEQREMPRNDPRRVESIEFTDDAMKLRKDLERLGESFRRNDSDGMIDYFDTNFYLHVGFHWEMDKDQ
jgi:hypothetical protein